MDTFTFQPSVPMRQPIKHIDKLHNNFCLELYVGRPCVFLCNNLSDMWVWHPVVKAVVAASFD